MKPNKEHIPSSVKSAPVTKAVNGDSVQRPEQPKQKKTKGDSPQVKGSSSTSSTSTSNRGFGSNNPSAPPNAANAVSATSSATWRTFSNPQGGQRGLMEKFILSRGRISSPTAFTGPAAPYVTPGSPAGDLVGVSNHSKVNYNKPARFAQSTAAANKTNAAPVMQPIVSSLTLKDVATKAEVHSTISSKYNLILINDFFKIRLMNLHRLIKVHHPDGIMQRQKKRFSKNFVKCKSVKKNWGTEQKLLRYCRWNVD